MEQFISREERIPVRGEYDLIVAGGGVDVADVDIPTLQATLAAQDVIIHFNDAWVPEGGAPAEIVDVGEV